MSYDIVSCFESPARHVGNKSCSLNLESERESMTGTYLEDSMNIHHCELRFSWTSIQAYGRPNVDKCNE